MVELIACPACEGQVSTLAVNCPQCGHPGPASNQVHRLRVIRGRVLLAVAASLFILLSYVGSLHVIGLALALLTLVALAFSFRSDRVAVVGGRCILGLVLLMVLAFVAD